MHITIYIDADICNYLPIFEHASPSNIRRLQAILLGNILNSNSANRNNHYD